jgi:hypothetical protein
MRHVEFISRPMNSRKILACEISAAALSHPYRAAQNQIEREGLYRSRELDNVCLRNVFISISIYICLQRIIVHAHYKIESARSFYDKIREVSREVYGETRTTSCGGKKKTIW